MSTTEGKRTAVRLLEECFGTALLVLVGPGAIMVAERTGWWGQAGVSIAFGLVVAAVVALFGAHINPSVTIAFWVTGRFPSREVLPYVASQLTGAVAGALLLRFVLGSVARIGATYPSTTVGRAFAIEFTWSALLALVVFLVTTSSRLPNRARLWLPSLAIGGTVALGAYVTGPYTGGSFNPARTFGPAIAGGEWSAHWLYWVAPTLGMMLVSLPFSIRPFSRAQA